MNRTTIQCPICKQFVTWQKIDFTRPDLAIDWKLEILCGCGPVNDPLVVRHCESEQKVRAYAAVWGGIGDRMRAILGAELDDALGDCLRRGTARQFQVHEIVCRARPNSDGKWKSGKHF